MRKTYNYELINKKFQIVVRNSLAPDPEQDPDPDWDFLLDPDSINMDPKHCIAEWGSEPDPKQQLENKNLKTYRMTTVVLFVSLVSLPAPEPGAHVQQGALALEEGHTQGLALGWNLRHMFLMSFSDPDQYWILLDPEYRYWIESLLNNGKSPKHKKL